MEAAKKAGVFEMFPGLRVFLETNGVETKMEK